MGSTRRAERVTWSDIETSGSAEWRYHVGETETRTTDRDAVARGERCREGSRKVQSSRYVYSPITHSHEKKKTDSHATAATASYCLLPSIVITKPIPPHLADKFASCFVPGVIVVDPETKAVSVNTDKLREETMSREVFRHPEFEGCVKLGRVRDWFICA